MEIIAANGSRWVLNYRPVDGYGRPAPKGRECWAQCVGERPEAPRSGLDGIVGFYASSLDAARARLAGAA